MAGNVRVIWHIGIVMFITDYLQDFVVSDCSVVTCNKYVVVVADNHRSVVSRSIVSVMWITNILLWNTTEHWLL